MSSLKDATVLVTGANGGLGTAYVDVALERGARRVYAAARNPRKWADERVEPLELDVADPASVEGALARAGDTTILVNNAALFPRGDLLHVLGVYPGPIDTPMQPGDDRAGMSKPSDIAAATFDALEAGEFELLPDEMTRRVHGALSQPVTALYPALASE
ncbi:SDR family NAD(P)-dependent oxidoreductase [Streptomyces sp. NPDC127159]|uniref:SDR family NAD(P)-dependent oxidoreductase n=1 Tax=unclassified Streptomyces TaxID=2593676 RepID=UPI00363C905F